MNSYENIGSDISYCLAPNPMLGFEHVSYILYFIFSLFVDTLFIHYEAKPGFAVRYIVISLDCNGPGKCERLKAREESAHIHKL